MDFLSATVISGVVYDFLKTGIILSAKSIKDFFVSDLHEITNEQAREIKTKIDSLDDSIKKLENLSKDDFINQYSNIFENHTSTVQNNHNSGQGDILNSQRGDVKKETTNIQTQNNYTNSNIQKKTD